MTNQFATQEKEIAELKKLFLQVNETLLSKSSRKSGYEFTKQDSQNNDPASSPQNEDTNSSQQEISTSSSAPSIVDMSLPGQNNLVSREENTNQTYFKTESSTDQKRFRSKGISKHLISLQNSKIGKALETVDNTIPAGTFAQGILLSGVDASTGTTASSNPEPVLIELTDSGDLSRHFTSTVKGCRVTASEYGVLSKERVMMRLEKLSCIEAETGEVLVMDVEGYVSGEDGKLGLRGTVVDRAGEHVRAAMIGGFLSSFGNFLAASSSPVTFAPQTGLAQIAPLTGKDLLKQGGAKGVSGALEKYTEFYIKRAEQLEPVIQVNAGRVVQVVFNKTVGIGKSALKKTVSAKNDKARAQLLERYSSGE
jgi:conjugal transfer pilus assembly protein TraB